MSFQFRNSKELLLEIYGVSKYSLLTLDTILEFYEIGVTSFAVQSVMKKLRSDGKLPDEDTKEIHYIEHSLEYFTKKGLLNHRKLPTDRPGSKAVYGLTDKFIKILEAAYGETKRPLNSGKEADEKT
jgi:hypothetical protein